MTTDTRVLRHRDIVSNAAHLGTTLTGLYAAGPNLGRERPSPYEAIMTRLARWRAGPIRGPRRASRPVRGH
jgi:hypothetical protein